MFDFEQFLENTVQRMDACFLWSQKKKTHLIFHLFHVFLLATKEPAFFPATRHSSSTCVPGFSQTQAPDPSPRLVLPYTHGFVSATCHLGCSPFTGQTLCEPYYCNLSFFETLICCTKEDNSVEGVDSKGM